MEIESIEIMKPTDDITLLDWMSTEGDFGRLTIEYNNNGTFTFDSEYLSLETVISIISKWKELEKKGNLNEKDFN